ncbi:hypothetical protein [Apis mellifera associated microvirus 48]|nr:hypothetical protein [Apis mellifera associated microvirus 48]
MEFTMIKDTSMIYQTLDDTPVSMPTRLRLPQSRTEQIRQYVREEMSRAAAEQGHESFEEADDFSLDDEEDMPLSPYELAMLEPTPPLQNGVSAEGAPPVGPAATSEVPAASQPVTSETPPNVP